MAAILEPAHAPGAVELDTSLLDQIVEQSRVAKSSSEHERARDLISELVSQVMEGTVVMSDNLSATLDAPLANYQQTLAFVLVILILLVRPKGIAGRTIEVSK